MSTTTINQPRRGFAQKAKRFAPIVAILAAIAGAFALGIDDYLSFDALRENREVLMSFTQNNVVAAAALFIAIYAVATALSLPGGAVLSIAGGFLFGSIFGTASIVLAATLGAVGIFLAARTALGDFLKAKAGPWLKKMEAGFQDNAFSYLLVLRLVPLFPFVVVNLVPAFLGVKLRTFAAATFIGIIPGSFVFASIGAGLGSVFDRGDSFSPANALTPEVIVALVGLSVLSIIPVVYKKIKARRTAA
ncbi:TVP38/TMEM64 family protein [Denitrobaculum tricleocarpae]|uniref:TVP38/TMEM64 family membrane protein n=1 Tax=Denitrobaculum tricleocarpae TaxID=2591009 RepID=A0A545U1Y5_9PROT|nr:TVP38/TMEM64 family protein [Denitrobaculum tricleocarpae]TQV83485.1 TVP38/TMEM64 family protein [Denitrobaculum tricleocarpae]